jgi:hypothetical protein
MKGRSRLEAKISFTWVFKNICGSSVQNYNASFKLL